MRLRSKQQGRARLLRAGRVAIQREARVSRSRAGIGS